jgi:hypothetical protein
MEKTQSYKSFMRSPKRSIKHSTYFDTYDFLFSKYRNRRITFVEVGVLGGGSLHMWRDFFGETSRIIGIDFNPDAKNLEQDGFEIFIGNQADPQFWKNFKKEVGMIDVVLDDGGHTYEQQIVTMECLLENISDGGLLVIEDTHTSYMNGFGFKSTSFINHSKNLIDMVNNRFSLLEQNAADYRIWSIEFFESLVAFKVNRPFTSCISALVENHSPEGEPSDFRYEATPSISTLYQIAHFFRIFKNLPGAYKTLEKVRDLLSAYHGWINLRKFLSREKKRDRH